MVDVFLHLKHEHPVTRPLLFSPHRVAPAKSPRVAVCDASARLAFLDFFNSVACVDDGHAQPSTVARRLALLKGPTRGHSIIRLEQLRTRS
jgi:hypothetical protein